jgi:hypothetical protein
MTPWYVHLGMYTLFIYSAAGRGAYDHDLFHDVMENGHVPNRLSD